MTLTRSWLIPVMIAAMTGCGSSRDSGAPLDLTPKALADEVSFRYRATRPAPGKARPTAKSATPAAADDALDGILDDLVKKLPQVKDVSPTDALRQAAAEVRKDENLTRSEREIVAKRLEARVGQL